MYLKHFSLKERPFSISPDPRFLFMSNRYREALAHLTYGVEDGGGFVLLTGEVGTGKTTVCRCLLQQLPEKTRLAFVLNPKLNSLELLATICDELNIEYPDECHSLKILTDKISQYLLTCYEQGLSVVVMIDEAQNIETEVLEQVRLLTNLETNQKKLLQIILVGQPELQEKLAQRNLRQLAQRITARYHLRPLSLKETMAYVLHRIRIAGSRKKLFTRKSIELLHVKTTGIPRLINTICDRALMAAASRQKNQVDHHIMKDAVIDVMGTNESLELTKQASKTVYFSIIGVAIISLLAAAFWLGQSLNQPGVQASNQSTPSIKSESTPIIVASNNMMMQKAALHKESSNQQNTLLNEMLGNERWDNNGHWSMQQLMSLWNVDYSPLINGNSCDFAATYGLVCRKMNGNWQQLRTFNRPAILKFSAGLQGEFWGTLKKLTNLEAVLLFGDREIAISIDKLSTLWTGEYQLVWQAPTGYNGDISLGQQGDVVTWLSSQLNQLVDQNSPVSATFDNALKTTLKLYQKQRNINADGIAGMQTILMINGETLSAIPQLLP